MTKRQKKMVLTVLLLVTVASTQVEGGWFISLRAQDSSLQDDIIQDDAGREQIFLPLIVENDPADLHEHGQPSFESWPPQPIGITDIALVPDAPSDSVAGAAIVAAQVATDEPEQIALASADVQAALGGIFIHTTTIRTHPKQSTTDAAQGASQSVSQSRVTYFSYSNHVTVEAVVQTGAVIAVNTIAAADYQPEPTADERHRAIDLARAYLLEMGYDRVDALEGYAIMAYRSQGATGFYDSRVLYVSFHEGLEERPEYLAWVDLSNETILKATEDSLELSAAKGQQELAPTKVVPASDVVASGVATKEERGQSSCAPIC